MLESDAAAVQAAAAPPMSGNNKALYGGRQGAGAAGIMSPPYAPPQSFNTEAYDRIDENGYHLAANDPLSTFSIDVDTASSSNVRRFLNSGSMPPADAVRIEELVNYFHFAYTTPRSGEPFSVTTEVAACPWNASHRLALVGLQARRSRPAARRRATSSSCSTSPGRWTLPTSCRS